MLITMQVDRSNKTLFYLDLHSVKLVSSDFLTMLTVHCILECEGKGQQQHPQ